MKIGDLVRVSPFIPKDPANQKGKVGVIVEIVKVRFSNDCYGLYDGEVLQLIKNDKKQKQ